MEQIFLIERHSEDWLENDPLAQIVIETLGFVDSEEEAKNICLNSSDKTYKAIPKYH